MYYSTLRELLLENLSLISSRFILIHKKDWNGGLEDETKVRIFNLGDLVLAVHGRLGFHLKWPAFKSIYYGPC